MANVRFQRRGFVDVSLKSLSFLLCRMLIIDSDNKLINFIYNLLYIFYIFLIFEENINESIVFIENIIYNVGNIIHI